MEIKKIGFFTALSIAYLTVLVGFFALSDIIQWVIYLPDEFTYWTFNNRLLLMGLGLAATTAAIVLNKLEKYIPKLVCGSLVFIYLGLFASGFILPTYVMFKSEHKMATFIPNHEVKNNYLAGTDEVLVLVNKGDARAYPNKHIVQPHIAGDIVGGEEIVMTYCGLSHLGQAYKSDVEGCNLNLKVMTQLKNNLVMFDANSQEPIPQIYGKLENSNKSLDHIPSTVMPYASFVELFPGGKVYFYSRQNFIDEMVHNMLDDVIYGEGGQYDKSTENLSFPSIKYDDNRLHPKKQIYGVHLNGESIAYTKDYLVKKGGVVTETIGGETITIKYYKDYDFVNIFYGAVPDVDHYGIFNQSEVATVPHFNRILWKVWANTYKDTEVRT